MANRELGTIEAIDAGGHMRVRLDLGRSVALPSGEAPHLDHGCAVTSHSSQGQTADRVLVHVDTEQAGEKLVNQRLAYVAVEQHPDKTFVGRIDRGFDFLGYRITAAGVIGVAPRSSQAFQERLVRFYEHGAAPGRIGQYVRRWKQYVVSGMMRDLIASLGWPDGVATVDTCHPAEAVDPASD